MLSYIFSPVVPRFTFKSSHLKAIMRYIRGMVGIPILTFIFLRADVFVAGKMLSAFDVGLYSMALSLARLPPLLIEKLASPLFMPRSKISRLLLA